jgi:hypothetical protein
MVPIYVMQQKYISKEHVIINVNLFNTSNSLHFYIFIFSICIFSICIFSICIFFYNVKTITTGKLTELFLSQYSS